MTFKFFDHMENILGDRRTIQGQNTISSTFATNKSKSKSSTSSTFMAQRKTPTSLPSTSKTISTNNAEKQIPKDSSESESGSTKSTLEKVTLSSTKTTICSTSASNAQKNKRPQHGSGSRTAANKMELEKQWLQHLKNVADRNKIKEEKQEAYEKRKGEEVQIKKKWIALKERQLEIKQNISKRKHEEVAEWHREKLYIEKQKCRLLRELLETRTLSSNKKLKTDTDSSCED